MLDQFYNFASIQTRSNRRRFTSYALASILGNRVSEDYFVRSKIGKRTLRAVDFRKVLKTIFEKIIPCFKKVSFFRKKKFWKELLTETRWL